MVPATLYPQAPQQFRTNGFLGPRGEFSAGFLSREGGRIISATRRCPLTGIGLTQRLMEQSAPTDSLLDQVAGWLQQISPGATIVPPSEIRGTDVVSLQFTYTGKARVSKSSPYRPTNVGFGLTYSLPIIVACLAAVPGALVLLENPEAHLHPQGQAAMGHLICQCAGDGVQVLVETHSDHLINGIRLAAKKSEINPTLVAFHYFSRNVETGDTFVQSPTLFANGRISNWPEGFFDQWDRDIDALIE
jgi:predicted ATPase